MAKERFELTSGKDLMWTVTDNENGIVIEFREGLFNESQEVKLLTEFTYGDAPRMARIMREIATGWQRTMWRWLSATGRLVARQYGSYLTKNIG